MGSNPDITGKIIEAIAKVKRIPTEGIKPESTLKDLGMDSLDGLNLFFELEESFDITIPDEHARSMKSVRDIAEAITRMLQGDGKVPDQVGA